MEAFSRLSELNLDAVITENVRPRRSEASLIHGEDPEIPFLLAKTIKEKGGDPEDNFDTAPPIHDPILRVALDTIIASQAMQLRESVEHVKRREWRISETNRKLKELREQEQLEQKRKEEEPDPKPEE